MRENIKKLFRINTISSRITFITLVFLGVLTFTLTAIVYQITRNWLEETAIANLEALASSRQLAVETYADTHFKKLAAFEQPDLEIKVENVLNATSIEEENLKAELASELQRKQLVDNSLAWVDVLDLNGNVFISTFPNRVGIDYSDDESYAQGLVHPYISDPFFDEGQIYIQLTQPLHNAKNQVISVLLLHYDASELLAIVGNYTGLGDTGETVLGTRIGDEIHFLAPLRFDPNLSEIPPAQANGERAKPMIHATSGQSGVTQAPDYRDTNVVAAYRPILSTNWGIVVKQDVDETFASITQIQVALLIAFLSLFVLSTLFISPMIKRALLPLTELKEATSQVAKGNLNTRVPIQYDDEIGDLAKTFNIMVNQLQETQTKIERSNEELEAFRCLRS